MQASTAWRRRGESVSHRHASPTRPRASSIERLSPDPEPTTPQHAPSHARHPASRKKRESQSSGHGLQGLQGLGLSNTPLHDSARLDPDHLYLDADGRAHLGAKHRSPKHEPESKPVARRSHARATATQYRGPPKRGHTRAGSTIDDLASIAIATSPQFIANPTFHFGGGGSPVFHHHASSSTAAASASRPSTSYVNGYSQEAFDRPAKRIKSERLNSHEWPPQSDDRPKSSYTYQSHVRKEDAELLLGLQNAFRFSPSTARPTATTTTTTIAAAPRQDGSSNAQPRFLEPAFEPVSTTAGESQLEALRHAQGMQDTHGNVPVHAHVPVPGQDALQLPGHSPPLEPAGKPRPVEGEDAEMTDEDALQRQQESTADALSDPDTPKPPPIQAATGTAEHEIDGEEGPSEPLPDPSRKPRRVPVQTQPVCPACKQMQYNGREGEPTINWINCDGSCNGWYHIPCAGFTDLEVKKVAKFICNDCEPTHGKTVYARTSSRARAAPDYAALNEGVMKTAEDTTMHHFVPKFKDGSIRYHRDDFARIRPDILTKDFWANMDGMKRPFVVPACWNPRFGQSRPSAPKTEPAQEPPPQEDWILEAFTSDGEPVPPPSTTPGAEPPATVEEEVIDVDQDYLDMIMPRNLTVRKVAELYGPDEPVPVIEVKTQETKGKFTLRQWANYYEETGSKPIRNVISLEVSHSRLGRLIRRPKVVRDIDLEPQVWDPTSRAASKSRPIAFYCLMSVGDSYTDFHIDFGGSSVYYHILKGQKTFFFIPPEERYLKKYEEWSNSPSQNDTWLPDLCGGNVTRVDLFPGDTAFIPAGWIHSVWTPCDSLVIGGNFLTRYDLEAQIKVTQIEKATNVAPSFRYPFFQKVMWYTLINYLEDDPVPESVVREFQDDPEYRYLRAIPVWQEPEVRIFEEEPDEGEYNARRYTKSELRGLPALRDYLYRTARIYSDLPVENINKRQIDAVKASVPKSHGDPLQLICLFAVWVAWKRGNETVPDWVHADSVLAQELEKRDKEKVKKAEVFRMPPERVSARRKNQGSPAPHATERQATPETRESNSPSDTPKLPYPRIACESCRKKRLKCNHLPDTKIEETAQQTLERPRSYSNVTIDIAKLARASPVVPAEGSQPAAPSLPPASTAAPTAVEENTVEVPANTDLAQAALARMTSQPPESNGTTLNGTAPTPTPTTTTLTLTPSSTKKGRSKACDECRKSKRRCVHDEHGRVDPAKAAEPSKPRGSHSGKRPARISDEHQSKKVKSEASHDNDYAVFAPQPDFDSVLDPALMAPMDPLDPMLGVQYQDPSMMVSDLEALSTPPRPLPAENSMALAHEPAQSVIDPNLDPALMESIPMAQDGMPEQPEATARLQPSALPKLEPVSTGTPDLDKSYSPITIGSADIASRNDLGEEQLGAVQILIEPTSNGTSNGTSTGPSEVNGAHNQDPQLAHDDHEMVDDERPRQPSTVTGASPKEEVMTPASQRSSSHTSGTTHQSRAAAAAAAGGAEGPKPVLRQTPSPKGKMQTSPQVKQEITPAREFSRGETVCSNISDPELDASEKLARELQAQEHGLRRRPSVRIS